MNKPSKEAMLPLKKCNTLHSLKVRIVEAADKYGKDNSNMPFVEFEAIMFGCINRAYEIGAAESIAPYKKALDEAVGMLESVKADLNKLARGMQANGYEYKSMAVQGVLNHAKVIGQALAAIAQVKG